MGHPKDYSLFGLGVPGHPFFFSQMTRNDLYAAFLSHRWGSRKCSPPIFWAKYTHDVWQVPFSLPKTSVAFSFPPPTSLENTSKFSGWKLRGECWRHVPLFLKIWWMREHLQKTRSECLQVFDHHETLLKGHWVHEIWQNLDNSGFSSTKMMHLGNRIFSSYFLKGLSIWCISHLQLLHPPEHGWTRWGVTRWLQWLHFVNQTIGCLPPPRSRIIIHRPIDPSSLKDVCSLQRP